MANKSGSQPKIQFCPVYKGVLRNVMRSEMELRGYIRKDGTVAESTHTYECTVCKKRFEITQNQ